MILGLFFGTEKQRLSKKEEINLFIKICQAKSLEKVQKESSLLYYSVAGQIYGTLYKKFKGYIPPKLLEDLEDAFIAGWSKVLENRAKFNINRSKSAFNWILTVILNETKNIFFKDYKTLPIDELEDSINILGVLVKKGEVNLTPEQATNSLLITELIENLSDSILSDKEKEVFFMRVKFDMLYKEISEALNLSNAMINKHLNNACSKLRKHMTDRLLISSTNQAVIKSQ